MHIRQIVTKPQCQATYPSQCLNEVLNGRILAGPSVALSHLDFLLGLFLNYPELQGATRVSAKWM